MKQNDKLDFVAAMEKEIEDHESRGHWHIVARSILPTNTKPIKAIWSFKRKWRPDGLSMKATGLLTKYPKDSNYPSKCVRQTKTIRTSRL